jgi:uncharacterized 2Fe-2S/4Fe-4S cluster protein (DUF4445 family)
MGKHTVTILPMHKIVEVEEGTTLLEAQIQAGLKPDAPCGGKGTCGKCLVEIIYDDEIKIEKACQVEVHENMTIKVKLKGGKHQLLMQGAERELVLDSAGKSCVVQVKPPHLELIDSEWNRIARLLQQS